MVDQELNDSILETHKKMLKMGSVVSIDYVTYQTMEQAGWIRKCPLTGLAYGLTTLGKVTDLRASLEVEDGS